MSNHLEKLRNMLLQSEDHSIGSGIKCVAHLFGGGGGDRCTKTEVFLFPSLETTTQVSHLHYTTSETQLHQSNTKKQTHDHLFKELNSFDLN